MTLWQSLVHVHGVVSSTLRLDSKPWVHWVIVYLLMLTYFLVYRCVALSTMLELFGTLAERSSANRWYAVLLGILEDFLLATVLLLCLSLVDQWLGPSHSPSSSKKRLWMRRIGRFLLHALLLFLALLSFAADMLLLRSRGLRFTFAFITTYVREFKFTSGFEVSGREIRIARETVQISAAFALLVLLITMLWLDLSKWHVAKLLERPTSSNTTTAGAKTKTSGGKQDPELGEVDAIQSLETGEMATRRSSSANCSTASPVSFVPAVGDSPSAAAGYEPHVDLDVGSEDPATNKKPTNKKTKWIKRAITTAITFAMVACYTLVLLVITHAVPAVVSAAALNDSLNELFRLTLGVQFLHTLGDGTIESAGLYLDANSESYELFQDDVLYRKTTGFKGKLAFDVKVDQKDPPNVVILTIESFRYQDSQQIVGNKSAALTEKTHNITLTPQFDKWAQKGITFRNFWSSWQTSRSVEGILFGQVPYDHISDSGTTTGRHKVDLQGLPQFFHKKGYETSFTTGARLNYDGWDKFFDHHGFDSVWGASKMAKYAETQYNISENDWKQPYEGGKGRSLYWGVHDDVSFDVLGDLLINKTNEQAARVAKGDAKKPLFLNHYTISSHTPWIEHPSWFDDVKLPDFSALYQDLHPRHHGDVKNYAKMRYFTDLALGQFLDRMKKEGILNDTIIVIVGDHGQSPEVRMTRVYYDEITTTRVAAAVIAEGRLAKEYAGLVMDDAAHQYDLLNTIADIVGVPETGFLQSGVGRSLKREIPFGERVVWSNNPMHTMAAIKGHQRLSYDRVFSMTGLFDAEKDPMETNDLLPSVSGEEQKEWEQLRENGRRLSRYFRLRWDQKCISKVKC